MGQGLLRAVGVLALLGAAAACADEQRDGVVGGTGGVGGAGGEGGEGAGARREGPWGPTWECEPGSLVLDDGTCLAAGIDPADCGTYFEPDGDRSCDPILPEQPCQAGMMAVPGETTCRELVACGATPFGDIPVDVDTVYVDAGAAAGGDGSAATPFTNIGDAIVAATDGALIAVASGTYAENLVVTGKRIRLWGRCPAEVVVDGGSGTAITFEAGAEASEVRGVTVEADEDAIEARANGILIEAVVLRNAGRAINTFSPDDGLLTIRNTLIEDFDDYGVFSLGMGILVEDVVIRDATPLGASNGMQVSRAGVGELAVVTLNRVLVEGVERRAVAVDGGALTLRDVVVRDVTTEGTVSAFDGAIVAAKSFGTGASVVDAERVIIEQGGAAGFTFVSSGGSLRAVAIRGNRPVDGVAGEQSGDGIAVYNIDSDASGMEQVTVRSATIDDTESSGVYIEGGSATLEAMRIRSVRPFHADDSAGTGVVASPAFLQETLAADLVMRGCLVEDVHEGGILTLGASVRIDGTRVEGVKEVLGGGVGRCIAFEHEALLPAASAVVAGSLVDGCAELGIGSLGVDLTIEHTAVRNIAEGALPQGACFLAQFHPATGRPAAVDLSHASAENCAGFGVFVAGASASLANTSIVTVPTYDNGSFGDGITVVNASTANRDLPATVALTDILVADAERAGLALFGATATFAGHITLDCNTIHMNGEPLAGTDASIDAQGEVACGCAHETTTCKLLSQNLQAPDPI